MLSSSSSGSEGSGRGKKEWVYPTTLLEVTRDDGSKVQVLSVFGNKSFKIVV